jgi:hypothetical protein
MTVKKKQKSFGWAKKNRLSYDGIILFIHVLYRPYKSARNFCDSSLKITQLTSTWNQSHIRLNGSIYLALIVNLLSTNKAVSHEERLLAYKPILMISR